ncbi:hypothetical protein EDB86DRAFT_3082009 [Lactarius hatsudake]|nr:hypothetical protein EDB86DRAFT_3082009 [Lactarius hatsudake]
MPHQCKNNDKAATTTQRRFSDDGGSGCSDNNDGDGDDTTDDDGDTTDDDGKTTGDDGDDTTDDGGDAAGNDDASSDERLTKWLNPIVIIINALSATLGECAGLVFPPTKIIFSGIGILLLAAKSTVASRDVLVILFDRIESFFQRLRIYTKVAPSPAVTDELAKIMAKVLSILAIATK